MKKNDNDLAVELGAARMRTFTLMLQEVATAMLSLWQSGLTSKRKPKGWWESKPTTHNIAVQLKRAAEQGDYRVSFIRDRGLSVFKTLVSVCTQQNAALPGYRLFGMEGLSRLNQGESFNYAGQLAVSNRTPILKKIA